MTHLNLYIFYIRKVLIFLPLKTSILLSGKETTDEDKGLPEYAVDRGMIGN